MAATDLSKLILPDWPIPSQSRTDAAAGQEIRVSAVSWARAIQTLSLPGRPPSATRSDGVTIRTRADVWNCAESLESDPDAVFTLLWHALAWGTGKTMFRLMRRLSSIAADVAAARSSLTTAADLSRTDPGGAYHLLLRPSPRAIKHLGPAFYTKFLYFAGGGAPDHPCLILDARVAKSLHANGWTSLHTRGPWPTKTYLRYLGLMSRWANEHRVAPDELELTLYNGELGSYIRLADRGDRKQNGNCWPESRACGSEIPQRCGTASNHWSIASGPTAPSFAISGGRWRRRGG